MQTLDLTPAGSSPGLRRGPAAMNPVDLAARRLGWLDRRQIVLAQNIANADTPNYRPQDLTPFQSQLAAATQPGLARTDARHLASNSRRKPGEAEDRQVAEATPDGNAVSLDREAVRMAETDTAHALALQVHRSFMGMFRLALGRQG